MAGLSNVIEEFIIQLLNEANGVAEIQRNELAGYFDCAPSQINYVLTTRFTPYKGYYIESRRGGGGYIKIVKVSLQKDINLNNLLQNIVGESITESKALDIIDTLVDEDIMTLREGEIAKTSISDRSLICSSDIKNGIRAGILKNILLVLLG